MKFALLNKNEKSPLTQIPNPEKTEVENDYEEVQLSTEENIADFSESLEDLYADITQLSSVAERDNYKQIVIDDIPGDKLFIVADEKFLQLQTKLDNLLHKLRNNDLASTVEDQESIQLLYDDLTSLRNYIISAYRSYDVDETDFSSKNKSKVISIIDESFDGDIQIKVAKEAEETIRKKINPPKSKKEASLANNLFVPSVIKSGNLSALAEMERKDPLNKIVASDLYFHETFDISPSDSLVKKYLQEPRYQTFLQENFHTPEAFEKLLHSEISRIENGTIDALERWLGSDYKSPFVIFKNVAVDELMAFANSGQARGELANSNIKYETFLAWVDKIPEMTKSATGSSNKTLGELFTKWMIEQEMEKAQSTLTNRKVI